MIAPSPLPATEPIRDCPRCPRLAALREALRVEQPDWWNAPVPAFGDPDAWLAIIGLAPGRRGANRTGRTFTGDASGAFLFPALERAGLSEGRYAGHAEDGLALRGTIILNAAKCLPPENRPMPAEVRNCGAFLAGQVAALPKVRVFLALGAIAHGALLAALGLRQASARFAHGAEHALPDGRLLIDSYHCSRQNTNTRRLTVAMFDAVFARARAVRDQL